MYWSVHLNSDSSPSNYRSDSNYHPSSNIEDPWNKQNLLLHLIGFIFNRIMFNNFSLDPMEDWKGHVAVDQESFCKTLLEAASVLDEIRDVASREGVVDDCLEGVVEDREDDVLDQIPDHGSQQVQDVVDGFTKVVASKEVVKMNLDFGEISAEVHIGYLKSRIWESLSIETHLYKALSIDQHGCHGMKIQSKDLK